MNEIDIAVDIFPYTSDIWSVSDYSGEQVYSKLALPLFRFRNDVLEPFAVKSWMQDNNKILMTIRENLYWSNGEQVTSHDYERAIKYIMQTTDNRYHKLLNSVAHHPEGIMAVDDKTLRITPAWYDPFIKEYLSLINFSPMHKHEKNIHAGPYEIEKKTEYAYHLRHNTFFCDEESQDYIKFINFRLIKSDPQARAYHSGEVQVSCDTSLNLKLYRESLQHPEFHRGGDALAMLLSPGNFFHELPVDILHLVSSTIDRAAISSHYDYMLEPIESWMTFYGENYFECDFIPSFRRNIAIEIDVAFEDFYPNKEILKHIAVQLLKYNVVLNLREDRYGNWISNCHFRFEIRKLPKNSPIQLVRSDISRQSKNSLCFGEIKKLYTSLFQHENKNAIINTFKELDFLLRKQALYIPLFIFPTGYYCHKKIETASLLLPGSRVSITGELQ